MPGHILAGRPLGKKQRPPHDHIISKQRLYSRSDGGVGAKLRNQRDVEVSIYVGIGYGACPGERGLGELAGHETHLPGRSEVEWPGKSLRNKEFKGSTR